MIRNGRDQIKNVKLGGPYQLFLFISVDFCGGSGHVCEESWAAVGAD